MEKVDQYVNKALGFMDNEYISATLTLLLTVYAGLAAPQLPERFAQYFDYDVIKVLVFFLILFAAKKRPSVAIIAAVGVLVSIQTMNRYKTDAAVKSMVPPTPIKNKADAPPVQMPDGLDELSLDNLSDIKGYDSSADSYAPLE
jgi:hypothetical protein